MDLSGTPHPFLRFSLVLDREAFLTLVPAICWGGGVKEGECLGCPSHEEEEEGDNETTCQGSNTAVTRMLGLSSLCTGAAGACGWGLGPGPVHGR